MLLGILSIIALGVGAFESTGSMPEVDQLALQETRPAIVQVIDTPEAPAGKAIELGL